MENNIEIRLNGTTWIFPEHDKEFTSWLWHLAYEMNRQLLHEGLFNLYSFDFLRRLWQEGHTHSQVLQSMIQAETPNSK